MTILLNHDVMHSFIKSFKLYVLNLYISISMRKFEKIRSSVIPLKNLELAQFYWEYLVSQSIVAVLIG